MKHFIITNDYNTRFLLLIRRFFQLLILICFVLLHVFISNQDQAAHFNLLKFIVLNHTLLTFVFRSIKLVHVNNVRNTVSQSNSEIIHFVLTILHRLP